MQMASRPTTPEEILDRYCELGAKKLAKPTWKLFLLGVLAGFLIGMGSAVTNMAAHMIDNVSIAKTISALLFPMGLGIVMLTGAELFTGNCMLVAPVLEKKGRAVQILRNWAAVYLGNFVGAVVLALALDVSGKLGTSGGQLAVYTIRMAADKCALPPGSAFVLGILCNILVCLGVLCSLSANDTTGRVVGAYIPVVFFVLCGFEHSVANMYYIPAGLMALGNPVYAGMAEAAGVNLQALNWGRFLTGNLLPVTLGNIVGGMALVLLLRLCYGRAKHPA